MEDTMFQWWDFWGVVGAILEREKHEIAMNL